MRPIYDVYRLNGDWHLVRSFPTYEEASSFEINLFMNGHRTAMNKRYVSTVYCMHGRTFSGCSFSFYTDDIDILESKLYNVTSIGEEMDFETMYVSVNDEVVATFIFTKWEVNK